MRLVGVRVGGGGAVVEEAGGGCSRVERRDVRGRGRRWRLNDERLGALERVPLLVVLVVLVVLAGVQ